MELNEEISVNQLGRDAKGKFISQNVWQLVRETYNGGRPRIYKTEDEMIARAMQYFEWADEVYKGKYAEADMRLFMGFNARTTYHDYKHNPQFSNGIYIIESILEGDVEKKLMWAGSTQGAIFKLKNKHGWKDETTQHQTVENVTANFGATLPTPQESAKNT